MAYGKDSSQLDALSGFRQRQRAMEQQKPKRGSIPHYVNKYVPSLHDTDRIRCIPGQFTVQYATSPTELREEVLPYFTFIEHYDGSLKTSSFCSGGPFSDYKGKAEKCRGCDRHWSMRPKLPTGKMGKSVVSKRPMFALTVLHFHPYARVPQVNPQGAPVLNPNTGEPYYNWQRVEPHQRIEFANYEQRDVQRMHWPMGKSHWDQLAGYDADIGKGCTVCGSKESIRSLAWLCGKCGDAAIDFETSTLPPEEVNKIINNPFTCRTCNTRDYLKEYIECAVCSPKGIAPIRATIFDVDLNLRRMKSGDGEQTVIQVTGWSAPYALGEDLAELNKPLKLDEIYAPTPWEAQVHKWGESDSVKPMTTGSVPYGRR